MSIYKTYFNHNTARLHPDYPTDTPQEKPLNHEHSGAFDSLDLNQAPRQLPPLPIIPVGTLVKVKLDIQPGGYGQAGWLTRSRSSEAIYLKVVLTVVAGEYQNRVILERIGIQGTKVDETGEDIWGRMGRSQLRAILESAYGLMPHDDSEAAQATRRLSHIGALNGLQFGIKVGKEKKQARDDREYNRIAHIITPDRADYDAVMNTPAPPGLDALTTVNTSKKRNHGKVTLSASVPEAMPTHVNAIPPVSVYQQEPAFKSLQASLSTITEQWSSEKTDAEARTAANPMPVTESHA